MSNRKDYYFLQNVTEAELDAGFDDLEQADFNFAVDLGLIGIVEGQGVSEKSGTPDLSVDVAAGTAYSKQGERINIVGTQNVDVSEDDAEVSTAVGSPGNEKWVSVFATFDRALSDPRIDGNSVSVFHVRDESFAFSVVQGTEAAIGAATRPTIPSDKVLLADVRLENGDTQVLDAEIYTDRREDAFASETGSVSITAGTVSAAVDALVSELSGHVDGGGSLHAATSIDYAGSGNWANGSGLTGSPTTVEAAIDQIVADLASIGSGDSGASRIGLHGDDFTQTWSNGAAVQAGGITLFDLIDVRIVGALASQDANEGADLVGISATTSGLADAGTLPASTVWEAFEWLLGELGSTTAGVGNAGDYDIGAGAKSDGSVSLSTGSVGSQLLEIAVELDDRPALGEQATWTGDHTFDGSIQPGSGVEYGLFPARTRYRVLTPMDGIASIASGTPSWDLGYDGTKGAWWETETVGGQLLFPLQVPVGYTLKNIWVYYRNVSSNDSAVAVRRTGEDDTGFATLDWAGANPQNTPLIDEIASGTLPQTGSGGSDYEIASLSLGDHVIVSGQGHFIQIAGSADSDTNKTEVYAIRLEFEHDEMIPV